MCTELKNRTIVPKTQERSEGDDSQPASKRRNIRIKEFTGITSPYEPPVSPELVIDSAETGAAEAAGKVILLLEQGKII
jgi:adenylylsulfate kinase-like enzyme